MVHISPDALAGSRLCAILFDMDQLSILCSAQDGFVFVNQGRKMSSILLASPVFPEQRKGKVDISKISNQISNTFRKRYVNKIIKFN